MRETDWIDVREGLPGNGTKWLVVTETSVRAVARYIGGQWKADWAGSSIVSILGKITHYQALPDLPPPRPKGPFKGYLSLSKHHMKEEYRFLHISGGGEKWEIVWAGDGPVSDFIDWLNDVSAKVEVTPSRYRAKQKSDDPVLAKRWAHGYYCKVGGRHCIVLDDVEVIERGATVYDGGALRGVVEVVLETMEEVE